MNIEQLVNDYPNDMELGKKVRELYLEGRKFQDKLSEKMKDVPRGEQWEKSMSDSLKKKILKIPSIKIRNVIPDINIIIVLPFFRFFRISLNSLF